MAVHLKLNTSDDEEETKKVENLEAVDAEESADTNANGEQTKRKRKRKRKKKSDKDDASASASKSVPGDDDDGDNVDKLNSLDHTVYVEGIPFVCKEDQVKDFFVSNGCPDVLQMRLPTWQDSGRLRGFGHIVFNTTESRNKAIQQLNGKNLQKRYLTIQEAKPSGSSGASSAGRNKPARSQPDGCRTIFVKNMPYHNISEEDIQQMFRSCGKIVEGGVRLARNYSTRELKGFGYVEFKNPEGAFAAVQRAAKGDIVLKGRTCYVDYEEGAMKGSFRNADGKLWQKEHGSVHDDRDSKKKMRR